MRNADRLLAPLFDLLSQLINGEFPKHLGMCIYVVYINLIHRYRNRSSSSSDVEWEPLRTTVF